MKPLEKLIHDFDTVNKLYRKNKEEKKMELHQKRKEQMEELEAYLVAGHPCDLNLIAEYYENNCNLIFISKL